MNNDEGQDLSDEPEYDPKFHVTAAVLRASGISVPSEIPDSAWVLRSSIVPAVTVHDPTKGPPDVMSATLRLEFTAPFRWVDTAISIPKEATQPCPDCDGSGGRHAQAGRDAMVPPCPTCDGLGFVPA